ncbi:unnamed protein product [Meloidogyne enterolobii]|uniref:Uncharacterized protein n=1 Tax=Meloidogyne enterolobii TaxID=390850 RepID=A0ACB0YIA7_MELEN
MFQKNIFIFLFLTILILNLSTLINGDCVQMCQGSSCSQICKKKRDVNKWVDIWGKFNNSKRRKRNLKFFSDLAEIIF